MSFLEPIMLAALPLASLPFIIHLINQRRYQTVRWGAMMFLLEANRMYRGYARLRQILIMVMRILAIAALIFAISRPLAGGWLGVAAGGKADATIVILDRSPSMRDAPAGRERGKLDTAVARLIPTLETLGSTRYVLIDSDTRSPRPFEKPADLARMPEVGPSSASADLPALLQAAYDYVTTNQLGRTELWILSDLRENDWNSDSGRWRALREAFAQRGQAVRFHLLAYTEGDPENLRLRVQSVRRRKAGDGSELLVSIKVERDRATEGKRAVPVQFEIEGARSQATLELEGTASELKDHAIPLEKGRDRGWGRVAIPADSNPADNEYYFTFEKAPTRRTVVVSDDPVGTRPLALAASISPDPGVVLESEVIPPAQLASVDWSTLSLLVWSAPVPEGETARLIEAFLGRGGTAIFLPPAGGEGGAFLGVKYGPWSDRPGEIAVESWRGDEDLLAASQSGRSLPVGELVVKRYRTLTGEFTPLASLKGGAALLARPATAAGAAYFLATTPTPSDSTLGSGGVVLYVLVQRAIEQGARAQGGARQLVAGVGAVDSSEWNRIAGGNDALSTDFRNQAGVYGAGDLLYAVNRSLPEDSTRLIADSRLSELFQGLDFSRVDEQAGRLGSLIEEIWRMFLVSMIGAMTAEAVLCLPNRARPARGAAA